MCSHLLLVSPIYNISTILGSLSVCNGANRWVRQLNMYPRTEGCQPPIQIVEMARNTIWGGRGSSSRRYMILKNRLRVIRVNLW